MSASNDASGFRDRIVVATASAAIKTVPHFSALRTDVIRRF
jgi:hypothetical protein